MADNDEFLIAALKDIKEDFRKLDDKFDNMHEVLVKNSLVLEEHQRRSTASEERIGSLENKYHSVEITYHRFKGFLFYTGLIISAIGTVAAICYDLGIHLFH